MQRGDSDGMDLCGMQGNLLIGVLVAGDWASCRLLKRGPEASRGGIRCAMEEIPEQVSGGNFRGGISLKKGFVASCLLLVRSVRGLALPNLCLQAK